MTELSNPQKVQLQFRDKLRDLALEVYESAQKAGLTGAQSAGLVAEECMHMSAFFVSRGATWDADTFAEECRKMFDYHKKLAAAEQRKPN